MLLLPTQLLRDISHSHEAIFVSLLSLRDVEVQAKYLYARPAPLVQLTKEFLPKACDAASWQNAYWDFLSP